LRWPVAVIAAALVAKDVAGAPRIRDPLTSLVELLPAWALDAAYEAAARGLHVAVAGAGALMLVTALVMAAILQGCRSPDRDGPAVHFLTPRLNTAHGRVEASGDAQGSDGGLSAREHFSPCPRAAGRRRGAEMPAPALRSPAGPA
jgi:hypothetical protein